MINHMRFPRTRLGWKRLFWLTLHRCPVHHKKLYRDWELYDDGRTLYGFCCDGVSMWPRGWWWTLYENAIAHKPKRRTQGND